MKIREIMSANPVCCLPSDTAVHVAQIMRDKNVGAIPIVADQQSRKLIGIITDRDLCSGVVAGGLDPKHTTIEKFISASPATCRDGENTDHCQQVMQEHKVRRVPVVDAEGTCIGIVSQADLALKDKPEKLSRTIIEVSRPSRAA